MSNKHIIQTLLRTYVVVTIAWSGSRNRPTYTIRPNYLVNNVFFILVYIIQETLNKSVAL